MAGLKVVGLEEAEAQALALSGAKGANLARMTSAGLPVPRGFVVTTDVFKAQVSPRASELEDALRGLDHEDAKALDSAGEAARNIISRLTLSPETVSAVERAYASLGGGKVSVRSSATVEDQAEASFAGQFSSYLNVSSLDDVVARIVDVWASVYTPHAIAYSLGKGISPLDCEMAVVVQAQLQPSASGVMFTRDPVNGSGNYVINATLGLGEGVVSGAYSVDYFLVNAETGEIESSDISDKELIVVGLEDGGTAEVQPPEAERRLPSLRDDEISDLVTIGKQVVELFGVDQDIEFAMVDGTPILLQARPISTGDASDSIDWEASVDTQYGWSRHFLLNRTEPLFQLQYDAARYFLDWQRRCFEETGSPRNRLHIAEIVNGYVYVRSPDVDEAALEKRQEAHGVRVDHYVDQGKSYFEGHQRPLIERRLEQLEALKPSRADLPGSVEYLDACLEAWGFAMGHLHWCMSKAERTPDWPETFHEITGDPAMDSTVFVQAVPNTITRLTARLRRLARIALSDDQLLGMFAERDYDLLEDGAFRKRPAVRSFREHFDAMLRIFGKRAGWSYGSSANILSHTWNMRPEIPLDQIGSYAEEDIDELERREAEALRERKNATRRMRRRLSGDPDRLLRFNEALVNAVNRVKMMEDHNYWMEQMATGTMREAIFAVGSILVDSGDLDDPDDVLHFSVEELRGAASAPSRDVLRSKVAERMKLREWQEGLQQPEKLGNGPLPEDPFAGMHDLPSGVGFEGGILKGVPASRGKVTGTARVMTPGEGLPRVHPGDILVAENAGSDWTPVLSILGGIVLDSGSVMQHAALVAREYRIPAVIMTKDATSVIKDGASITVDGDAGIVELDA